MQIHGLREYAKMLHFETCCLVVMLIPVTTYNVYVAVIPMFEGDSKQPSNGLDHADIHSQHPIHDNPMEFFQNSPHDTFHNNQALDELNIILKSSSLMMSHLLMKIIFWLKSIQMIRLFVRISLWLKSIQTIHLFMKISLWLMMIHLFTKISQISQSHRKELLIAHHSMQVQQLQ